MTRKCNVCAAPMMEGFVIDGGAAYYCSKPCLHSDFNEQDWNDMYADGTGDSYWTTWEDEEEEYGDDEDLDDVSESSMNDDVDDFILVDESSSMELDFDEIKRVAEGKPEDLDPRLMPHFRVNKYHYEDYEDGTYFEDGE